jgi:translocation and assembly module TamA
LQQTLKPGSFSYFRFNPEVRGYAPLFGLGVLAMRLEYGGMFTEVAGGGTPFTQRFFLGGQNDQRGFGPLRQGPKLGAQPCDPSTVGCRTHPTPPDERYATVSVPIGGTAMVLISAELRLKADYILNHLMVVPFVDASNVGGDPKTPFAGGLDVAAGLGLRYITPFGPIRFDVGYLLRAKDVTTEASSTKVPTQLAPLGTTRVSVLPTPVSIYCSSTAVNCIRESRVAFHISLGEAF